MNITIIDGQGGQIGAQLVKAILQKFPEVDLTAIGTNAVATAAMIKAGAKNAATGENPVVVACRKSDVIIGPVGIVITDALLGEITEKMAIAISRANAIRILIPLNRCDNLIAGVQNLNAGALIDDAILKLGAVIAARKS